ncbi:hypothetical protein T492DRAFT_1039861 [Pavlovales sp. CCMP2436]|nr:hypothetical protein T492DRAFT_1039861 [Pavlovales sp. CCMP2436]
MSHKSWMGQELAAQARSPAEGQTVGGGDGGGMGGAAPDKGLAADQAGPSAEGEAALADLTDLTARWALHWSPRPADGPPTWAPGERAVAKKQGACVVRSVNGATASAECGAGAAHEVPLAALVRVHAAGHVVCAETSEFRVLAATQLRSTDVVVEIGSSYGKATAILAKHCARVVGVDTSMELVSASRTAYPQLEFRQFDMITQPELLGEVATSCTVAFVDIGGNRELEGLLRVLPVVHRVLAPRLICIKSRELFRALHLHSAANGGLGPGASVPLAAEWWLGCTSDATRPAKSAKRYHNHGLAVGGSDSRFTQYPLAYLPVIGPDGRQICRFENYGVCMRGEACSYDHAHCHRCLQPAHVAKNCGHDPVQSNFKARADSVSPSAVAADEPEPSARRRRTGGGGPGDLPGDFACCASADAAVANAAACLSPVSGPGDEHASR